MNEKLEGKELRCDGELSCNEPVCMITQKGWLLCKNHGRRLKESGRNCRKLRTHELKRLQSGNPLKSY